MLCSHHFFDAYSKLGFVCVCVCVGGGGGISKNKLLILVFVCFVALRPNSSAMVMAGRPVHLTTLFLGKLEQAVNQYLRAHTFP